MNSVSKKVVAVTLSVFTFLPSMPVFAEAQLQQVEKAPGTAPTESNTLSQRVAEITGRQTVTHMPENEAYIPAGTTLRVEVPEELSSKKALLASLWVRNAAVPCNQATLGTFDFRFFVYSK